MPRRGASPAPSDPEIDIVGSLYPGEEEGGETAPWTQDADFDDIINGPVSGANDEDDGDEAFIALQQAASFRKSSNLKGRTVKKGGGFQAMGKTRLNVQQLVSRQLTLDRPQCESSQGDQP
jgi:ATP-dependent RNA helicase DDX54/DBP10